MRGQGQLRVALFVEGGSDPLPPRQTKSWLELIWNQHLPIALGLGAFSTVVPISKKHLTALDDSNPAMSGAGEALDALMVRTMSRAPFDAAVVAWDLVPAWNVEAGYCRWQETLDLYHHLHRREVLPAEWRLQASIRLQELQNRSAPAARAQKPKLAANQILPLCMDPMFEALLLQDEGAVKRALDLHGRIDGWPSSWRDTTEKHPDRKILASVIVAVRAIRPKPPILRHILGGMNTHKNEWSEYLLRRLLEDSKDNVVAHPIARRLAEIGPR